MKVGFQFSSTDIAVNPARVTPAAKGCYEMNGSWLGEVNTLKRTHAWATHIVFITDVYVFYGDL
jgi:hypothetical protein